MAVVHSFNSWTDHDSLPPSLSYALVAATNPLQWFLSENQGRGEPVWLPTGLYWHLTLKLTLAAAAAAACTRAMQRAS